MRMKRWQKGSWKKEIYGAPRAVVYTYIYTYVYSVIADKMANIVRVPSRLAVSCGLIQEFQAGNRRRQSRNHATLAK